MYFNIIGNTFFVCLSSPDEGRSREELRRHLIYTALVFLSTKVNTVAGVLLVSQVIISLVLSSIVLI